MVETRAEPARRVGSRAHCTPTEPRARSELTHQAELCIKQLGGARRALEALERSVEPEALMEAGLTTHALDARALDELLQPIHCLLSATRRAVPAPRSAGIVPRQKGTLARSLHPARVVRADQRRSMFTVSARDPALQVSPSGSADPRTAGVSRGAARAGQTPASHTGRCATGTATASRWAAAET